MANNIIIEGAQIWRRNFSGKEGQYNPAGSRNFLVFLDETTAAKCQEDGWNVRWLAPREDGESEKAYMSVAVRFDPIPPNIYMITSSGKVKLDEKTIDILDWAEITNVDLIIRPYNWTSRMGGSGIKAYVKDMYVTIYESELDKKYADVADSALDSMVLNKGYED